MNGLKFYPASHRYKLDGEWVPGVTTIIGKGLPKVLHYWSARTVAEYVADNPDGVEQLRQMGRAPMVAALKEVPWQQRDDAANRGTEVHALAERLVMGEEVDVPDVLAGHVDSYVRFLDDHRPDPMLVEACVGSREHGYAGKLDLIARIDGEVWLLDVKTSKSVYADTTLQLNAYGHAEFHGEARTEKPLPIIERAGVIHVRADDYDLVPMPYGPEWFARFLTVKATADVAADLKSLTLEPLEHVA